VNRILQIVTSHDSFFSLILLLICVILKRKVSFVFDSLIDQIEEDDDHDDDDDRLENNIEDIPEPEEPNRISDINVQVRNKNIKHFRRSAMLSFFNKFIWGGLTEIVDLIYYMRNMKKISES